MEAVSLALAPVTISDASPALSGVPAWPQHGPRSSLGLGTAHRLPCPAVLLTWKLHCVLRAVHDLSKRQLMVFDRTA